MQQIAEWLKKLGMPEYAERVAENRIDLSVLPDLTEQDLKDLDVLVCDRRKMLYAISDLGGASSAVTAPSAPRATGPTLPDHAEPRQVTGTSTDLVGSTALSTKLDPEDLRSVIGAYHKCVAARFDGFVTKYIGDGVLVYLGYPHAHEDDAVGNSLQVRIGVATGLVVVSDLVGSGEAQERGVVREMPNLPVCLQGLTERNAGVIAEGTRRLLGLNGIVGPTRAWTALRARSGGEPLRGARPDCPSTRCWSAATKSSTCSCDARRRPKVARVALCWSLAKLGSANRASRRTWGHPRGMRAIRICFPQARSCEA
jgi:class 3 adenylate cyclase